MRENIVRDALQGEGNLVVQHAFRIQSIKKSGFVCSRDSYSIVGMGRFIAGQYLEILEKVTCFYLCMPIFSLSQNDSLSCRASALLTGKGRSMLVNLPSKACNHN